MKLTVDEGIPVTLGVIRLAQCRVEDTSEALRETFADAVESVRRRFEPDQLGQSPEVQAVRRLFRAVGIDPTRHRPSGEALARRALKGQELYHINNVVDVNNLCSMDTLLPFGSYDGGRVRGAVHVRIGREGERYEGISKVLDIQGKLASADDDGAFGSPIADSHRTRIRDTTREVLVLVYAPAEADDATLEAAMDRYVTLVGEHAGARVTHRAVVHA